LGRQRHGRGTNITQLGQWQNGAIQPGPPVGIAPFTAFTSSGFTVNWSAGTPAAGYNPPGTPYIVQVFNGSLLHSCSPLPRKPRT